MKYFKQFELINYNNKYSRNILANAQIIQNIFSKYSVFYDYVIKDGTKPDYLAQKYYGDFNNTWIIYLSNRVINPYDFWPLEYLDFISFIEMKYNKSYQTLKSDISHYEYGGIGESKAEIERKSWKMSITTFDNLSALEKSGWNPIYVYDWEVELNEKKRNIKLLSNKYTDQISAELGDIL